MIQSDSRRFRLIVAAGALPALLMTAIGLLLGFGASGCAGGGGATVAGAEQPAKLITPPALVIQWTDNLQPPNPEKNPVTALYVRGDKLFAYTKDGTSYVISRSTGFTDHLDHVPDGQFKLHPPVVLKGWTVYPTYSTLEVYTPKGIHLRSIETNASIRSDAVGDGASSLFVALASPGTSRVSRYDMRLLANSPPVPLGERYPNTVTVPSWSLLSYRGSISAAPACFDDVVYIGGEDGLVMAVSVEDRDPIWPIEDSRAPGPHVFVGGSPIVANLSADESGLYIPTQDGELICVNRITGVVKWQYHAKEPPLDTSAVLTNDTVFIQDRVRGMVALDKLELPFNIRGGRPQYNRDPRWSSPAIVQILAEDEHYIFGRQRDNGIVALDKKTGIPAFGSTRKDLTVFATNVGKDGIIYAATSDGRILAIKAVTTPGVVGLIASAR